MTALIVGIVLIVGGIAFAAAPLVRRRSDGSAPSGAAHEDDEGPPAHEVEPTPAAMESAAGAVPVDGSLDAALDELDLDRAMGKLSPEDYRAFRAQMDRRAQAARDPSGTSTSQPDAAPAAMTAAPLIDGPHAPAGITDEVEDLIRALRTSVVSCRACGLRPEPGARFCSTCGASLGGCPRCGHAIAQPDARFCDRCGTTLAG